MKIYKRVPFILIIFLIFSSTYSLFSQVNKISDENITDKVNAEMFWQIDVPANEIDVETTQGIVKMEGTVNSLLAKERAEKVAMATRGVKGVVNMIHVNPPQRPDGELEQDILEALTADPATESFDVTVQADNGVITLDGEVQSWQEKQLVGYVTKDIMGVKEVKNEIDVNYLSDRTDYEIKQEIEQAINNDIRLYPKMIKVSVKDGAVGLSGSVGSLNEKLLAKSYAWTAGVKAVSADGLNVRDWAKNENLKKEKYPVRTDAQIKEAIEDAFLYDPRVASFNPNVTVNAGVVTLSGTVSNLKAKRAAAADARNVVGVSYVKNNLKVRPEMVPSNNILENRVENALVRDPDVEQYEIDVIAYAGKVYLSGEVDSYYEKYHAEDLASKVKGTVQVVNNIDVYETTAYDRYYPYNYYYPSPYIAPEAYYEAEMSDSQIKENIESELWWSPFVNESDVTVEVDQGVAKLTGVVDSWRERDAAIENAREGGAKSVIDYLVVENDND